MKTRIHTAACADSALVADDGTDQSTAATSISTGRRALLNLRRGENVMKRISVVVMVALSLSLFLAATRGAQSSYDDEFDSPVLDPKWLWIDPNDDCSWSLTDYAGYFTFTVPNGNDLFWYENYDAPRLVQGIRGNFVAETMIKVNPGDHAFKGGGLLAWDTLSNWIFISRDNSYYRQQVQITGNLNSDVSQYAVHMELYTPTQVYFKLHRYAHDFTFSYSQDGTSWQTFPAVRNRMSDSLLVGLVAFFTDYDFIGGTTTARFDYFRVIEAGFDPCMIVDEFSVDDSRGNGNGCADIGETIQLDLGVSNWGTPVNDIWATLGSQDPLVTVPGDPNSLGDLGWNERAVTSFLATIDSSCLADTIQFNIEFYSNGFSNEDSFQIHLQQPDLALVNVIIDDRDGNNDGRTDPGESVQCYVTVCNDGDIAAKGIAAELECHHSGITVVQTGAFLGDIEVEQDVANSAEPFVFVADTPFQTQDVPFSLHLQSTEYYHKTFQFALRVGRADILLMNDCETSYEASYAASLDSADLLYEYWNMKSEGDPPFDLSEYETVMWFTGDERDGTLTPHEQDLLAQYLNEGGHLIISGQNIGFDLVANGSTEDALFYANYLHAEYINDLTDETFLSGIQGDPISGEFNLFTTDVSQTSPSVIAPLEGASPILVYFLSGEAAAIKYDGDHKVVYFALGLEGLNAAAGNDDQVRGMLLSNTIQWFNYVPTAGDVTQDGRINIMDVLAAVNIVLGILVPTPSQTWAADCNADGIVNIMDVIGIVNVVLGIGTCPPTGRAALSPAAVEYLQSLKPYLRAEDFAHLMSLIKSISPPATYHLSQNYPNPFNPTTSIQYAVVSDQSAPHPTLKIFNLLGQEVKTLVDEDKEPGSYTVMWDGTDDRGVAVASGVYFCTFTAGHFSSTKRMVLIR